MLGSVPLLNWIPDGVQAPWFPVVALDLLTTTVIAAGAGIVLAILVRGSPVLWREGRLDPVRRSFTRHPGRWIGGIAVLGLAIYAATAAAAFDGRPLLIDEIVQVFQARRLAEGRLWIPAAAHPEFFSSLHLVEQDGRVYGQFPAGGPAMLALGALARAEWLVGPAAGALAVAGFGSLARRIEPAPLVALGATLLFGFAPFGPRWPGWWSECCSWRVRWPPGGRATAWSAG